MIRVIHANPRSRSGRNVFLPALIVVLCAFTGAVAQESRVGWYAFDAGFGIPTSSITSVTSVSGQVFAGDMRQSNTWIQSGFLSDTLFRPVTTAVGERAELPEAYALNQNYPNPFNPTTTITYALPRESHVVLIVYNLLGQEVTRLVDDIQESGVKSVMWTGRNGAGSSVASGVYFYRLEAVSSGPGERFSQIRKMLVVK